ncbi:putative endo-1 [Hyphodiscus hymeniophilus]|uniref:Endo-1 n=1 Tax=Hyphodiscus hymeniophilus TaxID=353542 RepID=A0A9P6VJU1_9HELO|nr:putative endo-1 [Hyphodiscus hymeniophilus]
MKLFLEANIQFLQGPDPTNGYQAFAFAREEGYVYPNYQNGAAYMGVDNVTVLTYPGTGRKSVRISSQKSWTHGLFISDIVHMPGGICGVWPAHWTLGPNWPSNGEIDIIEGIVPTN